MEQTAVTPPQRPSKFVRWAFVLGIVILLNTFFTVVASLALPMPQYSNYCLVQTGTSGPPATPLTNAATCDAQGGMWTEYAALIPSGSTNPSGYCDLQAKCTKPYQAALSQHTLYTFVLIIALGILSLIAGLMPTGSSIISSGLSYGGILALIVGSTSYWGVAGNWVRLLIAAGGLIVLLYVSWHRFHD